MYYEVFKILEKFEKFRSLSISSYFPSYVMESTIEKNTHPVIDITNDDATGSSDVEVVVLESQKRKSPEKEEERCPICLCPFETPSMLDQCFHKFCFFCILQWSQIEDTPRCPLCKSSFDSILYNIKSNEEYQRYYIKETKKTRRPKNYKSKTKDSFNPNLPFSTAHSLRRAVYSRGIRAIPFSNLEAYPKFKSQRTIQFSPDAFKANPSQWKTKLTPWITRELQSLLETEDVELLTTFVLSLIESVDITDKKAIEQLKEIIFDNAETFAHELLCFANSPFDSMQVYDKAIKYDYSKAKNTTPKIIIDLESDTKRQKVQQTPIIVPD